MALRFKLKGYPIVYYDVYFYSDCKINGLRVVRLEDGLRLPDSLHNEVKSLVKKEGVSINQFISSAVAEKMSALLTEQYLIKRSEHGDKQAFLQAMSKVPDIEPDREDSLQK